MTKRHNHTGRSEKAADHVRLYAWFMDSAAWRDLTPVARALYVLLKALYKGNNNGLLVLSVRQVVEELHISKSTAAKAFLELQAHGFIEAVIRGSFGGRKDRRATEWLLTEHRCDVTGNLPSKRFMRWTPGSNFTVRGEGQGVPQGGLSVPQGGLLKSKVAVSVPLRGL
ncbi:hypothetical protein SAMN02799631_00369 [Methylobacterium sp. 174MFSha1.1]|uniref:hypothetical protein n=1 Tax=Methylobacterium sp. 174MFSha1.1 TaxID=1502749 RepID=UPI0008E1B306|nr:hypothetical protein [Methylobacterium sp. 174MFSha1.1]SFU38582.1 hypothetical protein SAMN02799631_00369 [Methylobacterium sp. 174MFSha1.1]